MANPDRERSFKEAAKDEANDILMGSILPVNDWKESKVGTLTGVTPLKRGVKKSFSGTGKLSRYMFSNLKKSLSKTEVVPLETDASDPKERFEFAIKQYGYTPERYNQAVRASFNQSIVYFLLTMVIFGYAFFSFFKFGDFYSRVYPFIPLLIMIPITLKALFSNWQLRHRSLRSFGEFMVSARHWIPSARSVATLLGLAVIFTLTGGEAFAAGDDNIGDTYSVPYSADFLNASTGFFADVVGVAPSTDVFTRALSAMFGGVGPVPEMPGHVSPYLAATAAAFKIFNGTLFTIGLGMLGWQTLAGTVATAYEGQVLGQKWNTIWAPTRVAVGISMLGPFASGFCAVQLLVLHIALIGSQLGNTVWYTYMDALGAAGITSGTGTKNRLRQYNDVMYAMTQDEEGFAATMSLFESAVCLRGLNQVSNLYQKTYEQENGPVTTWDKTAVKGISGNTRHGNNALAKWGPVYQGSYEYGPAGPGLSLQEIHSGMVQGYVGVNVGGSLMPAGSMDYANMRYNSGTRETTRGDRNVRKMTKDDFPAVAPTVVWNFGELCGSASITMSDVGSVAAFIERAKGSTDGRVEAGTLLENAAISLRDDIQASVMTPISEAADLFVGAIAQRGKLDPATSEAYYADLFSTGGELVTKFLEAYDAYTAITKDGRNDIEAVIFNDLDGRAFHDIVDLGKELGWSASGAFYLSIARHVEYSMEASKIDFNSSSGMIGNSDLITRGRLFGDVRDDAKDVFTNASTGLIPNFSQASSLSFGNLYKTVQFTNSYGLGGGSNQIAQHYNSVEDEWLGLQSWINETVKNFMTPLIRMNQPDPYTGMLHMVETGHVIIQTSAVAIGAYAATQTWAEQLSNAKDKTFSITGLLSKVPFLGGVVDFVSTLGGVILKLVSNFFFAMGWMLFALGVVHAYLIPMMPFIYMFFISTGMLILVAEAMVAAPIWAFMHIRMDGGDFVDNVQRPGYMIAWNLFLRPALAVFGLILSFSLFSGSFWLLNETFGIASEVATPNDWGIAAIGMLVMAAIQVYMHYQLALRSFGLITELPERVSRWFGQGGEQLNESRDAEKAFGLLVDNSEKRLAGAGDRASGIMEGQTQMDGVEATQAKTTPGNGSVKARKK